MSVIEKKENTSVRRGYSERDLECNENEFKGVCYTGIFLISIFILVTAAIVYALC